MFPWSRISLSSTISKFTFPFWKYCQSISQGPAEKILDPPNQGPPNASLQPIFKNWYFFFHDFTNKGPLGALLGIGYPGPLSILVLICVLKQNKNKKTVHKSLELSWSFGKGQGIITAWVKNLLGKETTEEEVRLKEGAPFRADALVYNPYFEQTAI